MLVYRGDPGGSPPSPGFCVPRISMLFFGLLLGMEGVAASARASEAPSFLQMLTPNKKGRRMVTSKG